MVRAETCVGCGACVPVCPEPGAIRLEGKMPVIDTERCLGHGECVKTCPTGGLILSTGGAVQRIEVPFVSPHFETNVFGLYVVGELGGRGLIKNAVNEGKIAMEHVVQRTVGSRGIAIPGVYDVIVVGSGPAGISAGLTAHQSGLQYLVLEQGTLSDTIRRYPRHKLLLAEPVRMPLYGDLWVADTSKEALLTVWRTIIERTGLQVHTGCRVGEVVKRDGILEVHAEDGIHRSRHVVLALGRRGTPRRLGVPGEDLPHVFYDIVEMEAFAGKRVLVVGGGDSAIESAVGLANQPGTTVTLSYRGEAFARVKDRNRTRIDAEVSARRVRLLLRSHVREILAGEAALETGGGAVERLPYDYVIIRIGGDPPHEFLRRAGVRIVEKELALTGAASHAAA
jgi:thioredoxin reductase/ferredoxin